MRRAFLLALALAVVLPVAGAHAASDDLALFSSRTTAPPNIMFLVDTSGSMAKTPKPEASKKCDSKYCKWEMARDVVLAIVQDINPPDGSGGHVENARFGLFFFDKDKYGGRLVVPIADGNTASLLNRMSNFDGNKDQTGADLFGGTPLGPALVDVGRYFAGSDGWGDLPLFGNQDMKLPPGQETAQLNPIDGECRQNSVIVLSDGRASDSDMGKYGGSSPGNFCTTIGDSDGDGIESCGNKEQDWLDDVSYTMYRYDFAPLIDGTQKLTVHTIGFDLSEDPDALLLLQQTAAQAGGVFATANDYTSLYDAFSGAVIASMDASASFSAAAVPSSRSAFSDVIYIAFFEPDPNDPFWRGHLQAFRLSPDLQILDKNGNPAIDPVTSLFIEPRKYFWDAGVELSKPTHPTRKLYTANQPGNNRIPFNTVDKNDLDIQAGDLTLYPNYPTISFGNTNALANGLKNYIEGKDTFDKDGDGNTSELRDHILGDIMHSAPISIGPPPVFLGTEEGFGPLNDTNSFWYTHRHRDRMLYVGANDGMLHGFKTGKYHAGDNPSTPETENGYYDVAENDAGQEAFGYVPTFLADQLKYIPINDPRTHYYVDGSPVAADAWLPSSSGDSTKDASEWATVLISGMRQGGSGYVALNVTDPTAGSYPELLWEFDETMAPLGETWSEPVITRVKIQAGSTDLCGKITTDDGPCREQWVAIFGGGYRNDGDPNLFTYISDPASASWTDESKGIFMVALDTGQLIGQVLFDSDPTAVTNAMRFSIPSTPAVLDLDFDGYTDVVYVGDLGGQMWRWDISEVGTEQNPKDGIIDNWPVGLFFKSDPASMTAGGLHYHSIFFPPVATYLNGQLVLAFGSGERTDPSYLGVPGDDDNNRFWVTWDRVPLGQDPTDPNSGWLTLFEGHQTIDGKLRGLNDVSNLATDPEPNDDGYFVKAAENEKFITNHILFGGVLLTLSYRPLVDGNDICKRFRNTNIWAFNLDNAGGLLDATAPAGNDQRKMWLGPGAPTDPRISITKDKVVLIGQTSMGNVFEFDVPVDPPPPVELVFWRQLY